MLLTDILVAFRVWAFALLLFVWLPARIFGQPVGRNLILRTGAHFARMLLFTVATVPTLAGLHILNWFTLMLFYAALLSVRWMYSFKGKVRSKEFWNWFLQVTARWEFLWKEKRWKPPFRLYREFAWYGVSDRDSYHSSWDDRALPVAAAGILAIVTLVHLWWPLQQLRYPGEQSYAVLIRVRELMIDLHPFVRPLVMPALLATISSLSSVNCMEVTRFVSPVLGIFLAISGGVAVAFCVRSIWSGILATMILGSYALVVPASVLATADPGTVARGLGDSLNSALAQRYAMSDYALGVAFLFLGIAFVAEWYFESQRTSLLDAGCCLVLLAVASPTLLPPILVMGLVFFVGPGIAVFTMSLVWIVSSMLPVLVPGGVVERFPWPPFLDVAVALAISCVFAFCERAVRRFSNPRMSSAMAAGALLLLFACMPPQIPQAKFMEYDAAARQLLRIENSVPRQHWAAVAPLEQFSESLGLGKYEDLGEFVSRSYEDSRGAFQFGADTLVFVFVEKRPFRTFENEPPSVPFATLVDPTYRNYRSPAGRASLEWRALRLCEDYKQSHSDASIFYEDDDLRIYTFRSVNNSTTKQ